MDQEDFKLFVGIDWATQTHQACVVDGERNVVAERAFEHAGDALAAFARWLTDLAAGEPTRVAVAIEVPRGSIVETLIERGFAVFAINPKQLDRFRDRHTVAGAKDDRRDAFVLADSVRTDRPCFRRVRLDDPLIVQIREWSRMDQDLRQESNRLVNRLREQLHRFYPQMLQLCTSADEPWLWSLVALAPTPQAGAALTRRRVDKLLREHHIRRIGADQVLAALRQPPLHVAPGVTEAASAHIDVLLPRLHLVHGQRRRCAKRLDALLDELAADESSGADEPAGDKREHRDVAILRSLPGVGRVVAATMLAEASRPLAERDYHALRAHAGVAPVTEASGKRSGRRAKVVMRQGCNGLLREALYHWARTAAMHDEASAAYYKRLRQRGHRHGRALRSVADRLLRILMAMLRDGTLYDPGRTVRRALSTTAVLDAA
jgi:transposase